jgi:hypothetical protein
MQSLLPQNASLLPQTVAFTDRERALLDDLAEAVAVDDFCDALFADVDVAAVR